MQKSCARVGVLVSIIVWSALSSATNTTQLPASDGEPGAVSPDTSGAASVDTSGTGTTGVSVSDAPGGTGVDIAGTTDSVATAASSSGVVDLGAALPVNTLQSQILQAAIDDGSLQTDTGSITDLALSDLPAPAPGGTDAVSVDTSALSVQAHDPSAPIVVASELSAPAHLPAVDVPVSVATKLSKKAAVKPKPAKEKKVAPHVGSGPLTYAQGLAELRALRQRMRIRWAWVGTGKKRKHVRLGKAALSKKEIRKRLHHEKSKKPVVSHGIRKMPVERVAPKVSVKAFGG